MTEKRGRKGRLLMGLGLLLMTAALVLGAQRIKEERDADAASQRVLAQLEADGAQMIGSIRRDAAQETPVDPLIQSLMQPEKRPLFVINPDMEMPITIVDGQEYIGVLELPVLNLLLPVMSDWSYPQLKIAPCRYKGSAYTGDLIISGHNYDRHFGHLSSMKIGDEIRFTDADGNAFYYSISRMETLAMTDVSGMLEGEWDMTLFTCVPGGSKRVTLRCALDRYIAAQ